MELSTSRLDDAVSPVVGVILMVAVTVILAAVIGTFVLDLGNNVQENPQAGVTFDQTPMDSSDIQPRWDEDEADNDNDNQGVKASVQVISMENADAVYVTASDEDSSMYWDSGTSSYENYFPVMDDGSSIPADGAELTSVGDSATIENLTPGDTLTVVGELEGKQTVLQTYTVQG